MSHHHVIVSMPSIGRDTSEFQFCGLEIDSNGTISLRLCVSGTGNAKIYSKDCAQSTIELLERLRFTAGLSCALMSDGSGRYVQ